jgi:hypothetical protein
VSVYYCPLCPLVFEHRSDVETHRREEHRARPDGAADLRDQITAATRTLDWDRLQQLRSARSRPSVTLMLSTVPALAMSVLDIARLRQLAERARRRLYSEPDRGTVTPTVEDRLAKAVAAAETLPTERGLAILVNHRELAVVRLPFAPRDRHIVDDVFASRDLEYSLRRYPRYRVLVLGRHPRLLEGRAHHFSEPLTAASTGTAGSISSYHITSLANAEALVRQQVTLAGPLPLVLVGDRGELDSFRRTPYSGDVLTEVRARKLRRTNAGDLAAQAVERWQQDHQHAALTDLSAADSSHQVAWGIQPAWNALQMRTADRLWVEHDYAVPGRILPGTLGLETTSDPAEPGVIDDLVDALLTRAAQLGVPVDLLDQGALDRPEPVAVRIDPHGKLAAGDLHQNRKPSRTATEPAFT